MAASNSYGSNVCSLSLVGIDIGGTATRFICVDQSGNVIAKAVLPTPSHLIEAEAKAFLLRGIDQVLQGREPGAIGIGASGPIDAQGIVRNPDTLPAFTAVDIAQPISDKYRVHCMVENDAVAAAVAENRIGSSAGFSSAIMITLGTGVGVSMIQNGVPVRGADGVHPESGHMTVNPVFGAAHCYCGKSVCWEQMASRTALQTTASAMYSNAGNAIESIGIAHKAALSGDAKAIQLFDRYGIAIAQGLVNLLTIYRPPCVVIGGAGAQYFDLFNASLRATLALHVGVFPDFTLLPATLGDFGGAIGAALMAHNQHKTV